MVNHNENDKVHKTSFGATQYNWRVPLWGHFWPGASRYGGISDPARAAMGAALVRHLIYVDHVQYSSSTFVLDGPSFQPNTWVWFIMSITHCIIMVMHAMLPIMAKLVRSPGSSSGREPFHWRHQEPFMAANRFKTKISYYKVFQSIIN